MQSHGLEVIPVSIEQLRATLRQKSLRTQKAVRDKTGWQSQTWLGNPFGIPRNSAINPIPDFLNSGIFIRILFFPIVKCVPANSEHDSSGLESSPAIDSSDFMNRKTFLLYVSGNWHQISILNAPIFLCAHHCQTTAHNIT